jgi:hypothetical protein
MIRKFIIFFENNINNNCQCQYNSRKKDNMIRISVYKQGHDVLIGACDEQLLGKTFSEGKYHLHVSKKFYGANRISTQALQHYLKEATIANLVGEKAVQCAIQLGLVDASNVLTIQGIPHAQMVRMH